MNEGKTATGEPPHPSTHGTLTVMKNTVKGLIEAVVRYPKAPHTQRPLPLHSQGVTIEMAPS